MPTIDSMGSTGSFVALAVPLLSFVLCGQQVYHCMQRRSLDEGPHTVTAKVLNSPPKKGVCESWMCVYFITWDQLGKQRIWNWFIRALPYLGLAPDGGEVRPLQEPLGCHLNFAQGIQEDPKEYEGILGLHTNLHFVVKWRPLRMPRMIFLLKLLYVNLCNYA